MAFIPLLTVTDIGVPPKGIAKMQKPWTEKDDKRLLKMKSFRTPIAVIAKELGRTEAATTSRYKLLKPRNRTMQAKQVAQQYLDDQRALLQMLQSKLH